MGWSEKQTVLTQKGIFPSGADYLAEVAAEKL